MGKEKIQPFLVRVPKCVCVCLVHERFMCENLPRARDKLPKRAYRIKTTETIYSTILRCMWSSFTSDLEKQKSVVSFDRWPQLRPVPLAYGLYYFKVCVRVFFSFNDVFIANTCSVLNKSYFM